MFFSLSSEFLYLKKYHMLQAFKAFKFYDFFFVNISSEKTKTNNKLIRAALISRLKAN